MPWKRFARLAVGEVVEVEVLRDETIGEAREGAIHVPKDASHLAAATKGAPGGVEPAHLGFLPKDVRHVFNMFIIPL